MLKKDQHPFSNNFNAMTFSRLTDSPSTEEIVNMPIDTLVKYICEKEHNHFSNPENTAKLLQQATHNFCHLNGCLYKTSTIVITFYSVLLLPTLKK
ncbi:hypothetical protein [Pectinatus frisingensis]|uniref:hypothetical protein n=1 Tax=Pectinatus frisingensis TaxID=865 RepID=UPI0018C52916|nr:hypothetical protein [Pectinatus frisingensis]